MESSDGPSSKEWPSLLSDAMWIRFWARPSFRNQMHRCEPLCQCYPEKNGAQQPAGGTQHSPHARTTSKMPIAFKLIYHSFPHTRAAWLILQTASATKYCWPLMATHRLSPLAFFAFKSSLQTKTTAPNPPARPWNGRQRCAKVRRARDSTKSDNKYALLHFLDQRLGQARGKPESAGDANQLINRT